jgi:hypothetical protein
MDGAGDYRFVLHCKDAHPNKYRDHLNRRALDLNSYVNIKSMAILLTDWRLWDYANFTKNGLRMAGYAGYKPEGSPENGGSGLMINKSPRVVTRTLDRLSPLDPASYAKYCTKNAVWVYYGHGCIMGYGNDANSGLGFGDGFISCGMADDPGNVRYDITSQDLLGNYLYHLDHIELAYFACCYSAGKRNEVPMGNSIAASFCSRGAKASIGFRGEQRLKGLPFKLFNDAFWDCMVNGCNVKKAYDTAKIAMKYANIWPFQITPVMFGDGNIKLVD